MSRSPRTPITRRSRAVLVLIAGLGTLALARPSTAANPCAPNEILVNPCRPWLGAVASAYPHVGSSFKAQYEAHEARIGRKLDVVHGYKAVGQNSISADERSVAERGSILYLNWKPATKWADAGGASEAVNRDIDAMATQVASLAPAKIMLAIFGEPERFTSKGTSLCPGLKGESGSPDDYKAMWANVQTRFDAIGATNVVWVANFLGYAGWDCLFPELWPGNDRVDWIVWDPYVGPGQSWDKEVGYFYDALEKRSDAEHDFVSKPWGLAEFGSWRKAPQAEAYKMYDDALASLQANRYPRLKLYEPFDTTVNGQDSRIGFNGTGVADPEEQVRYNRFANDPAFSDEGKPNDPDSTTTDPGPAPTTTTAPALTTTTTAPALTTTTTAPALTTTTTAPALTTTTTAPVVTTTTIPGPEPTDHFAACDVGVETSLSCFAGIYNGTIGAKRQAGGHSGSSRAVVTNTSALTSNIGLNVKPTPVAKTEAGRKYTGSVWVRASKPDMTVNLWMRERTKAGKVTVGAKTFAWKSTDTNWHLITGVYIAAASDNELSYSVWASLAPNQSFSCDDFALKSTRP